MTPIEFLKEEFTSVQSALEESLRHEYAPDLSGSYFKELKQRLAAIERQIEFIARTGLNAIEAVSVQLRDLAHRISLIERSHLGEFSWPFAQTIRDIGTRFHDGDGHLPIVHVMAEGAEYKIVHEHVSTFRQRAMPVVAFPRQFKHHVLLHALFGHELGHMALRATESGRENHDRVLPAMAATHLQSPQVLTSWLRSAPAPGEISSLLTEDPSYKFNDVSVENWIVELTADLFGLVLFGPAFIAAHRVLLAPRFSNPYRFDLNGATHPPLAVRRKMLIRAATCLGWDRPTLNEGTAAGAAEQAFLDFILEDSYHAWADIFSNEQLTMALEGVRHVCRKCAAHTFNPIAKSSLSPLINRFTRATPPVREFVRKDGNIQIKPLTDSQILYLGWLYWLGRRHLNSRRELTFLHVNRLCDLAMLQHRAISLMRDKSR